MTCPAPQSVLFTGLDFVRCGDLQWLSPQGAVLPVAGPPLPHVVPHAQNNLVPHGLRLRVNPARKTDPLPPHAPRGNPVFLDAGVYRSWRLDAKYPPKDDFGAMATAPPLSVDILYCESRDGFDWVEKHRCPIDAMGLRTFDGMTAFIDAHAPPAQRYKFVFCAVPPADQHASLIAEYEKLHPRFHDWRIVHHRRANPPCMYAATSPDGLQWTLHQRPLMVHYSDTDTTVMFDERLGRYVMYSRLYNNDRREIARCETDDFWRWPQPRRCLGPSADSLHSDIYTNACTPCPDMTGHHLMFPMVYDRFTQRSAVHLYSSPDNEYWSAVPGGPSIAPGAPGAWDSQFIHAGKNLLPLGPERVAVPYFGTCFPHKYPRWPGVNAAHRGAWAYWPKGRLAAITADESGEFWAFGPGRPVRPAGTELRLNVRTQPAGMVRVGVVGVAGRAIEDCDPIVGDGLALAVHWRGDPQTRAPLDQPVSLHFELRAAELFGLEWV